MLDFLKRIFKRGKRFDAIKNYHQNYKSDKRIKGGENGSCSLCEGHKLLRLSHIVPKWCYQWCKMEGDGKMVGRYHSIGIRTIEQDGNKHYLLCDDCEQYLSVAEKYVKTLMHGTKQEQETLGIEFQDAEYKGLKVELVRRFVFGIALKSHFATSAPFHNISISEADIKLLRNELLQPTKGDLNLMVVAMQFYSVTPGIDPRAMMIPQQTNTKKVKYLSFLIAGWEWFLFFHEKRKLARKTFLTMRLKINGEMRIPSGDILDHRSLKAMFK